MAAGFHTCWSVNLQEKCDVLYEMCSNPDGSVTQDNVKVTKIIKYLIAVAACHLDRYNLRDLEEYSEPQDLNKRIQDLTKEALFSIFGSLDMESVCLTKSEFQQKLQNGNTSWLFS